MNGDIKRVLKAPTQPILDLASLQHRLPLYASDKEDGIRCIIHPKLGPVSQTMKPIPNLWVRELLNRKALHYLDGELVAINCEGNDADFNDTQSAIMTQSHTPSFEYRVFDTFENQYAPFEARMIVARQTVQAFNETYVKWLMQRKCESVFALEQCEAIALSRGKEGIMLRHPKGWYKENRSTLAEAYLLKVKRFTDDEAIVIGLEEEMENCNPATREISGLQKRSKHLSGLKGKGCIGALVVRWKGKELRIASGMREIEKFNWWETPSKIIGRRITFKYQLHGMKDLPRCPVLKGLRLD